MEKQEIKSNKKVITFKIAGEDNPTPNHVYDCEVPIYPVDFACQHKKLPPWWERELNYRQLQDLLNIWYYELEEDYRLFCNQVKEQVQKDLMIYRNQQMLISLAQDLNKACICQRSLECELEILSYQIDYLHSITERFEILYSQPMRENQCKLSVYRLIDKIHLKLKQTEYNMYEVNTECNERFIPFKERGPAGQIMSIVNVVIFTLQKLSKKLGEVENLLDSVTASRTKYVGTATEYAKKNCDFDLLMDIVKFKRNAP